MRISDWSSDVCSSDLEFRHGPHGAARIAHRVDLVDGDGRQNALDPVNLRLVRAVEKLAGIGRKGFDVAMLALGIQRVEGQRTLARARYQIGRASCRERGCQYV